MTRARLAFCAIAALACAEAALLAMQHVEHRDDAAKLRSSHRKRVHFCMHWQGTIDTRGWRLLHGDSVGRAEAMTLIAELDLLTTEQYRRACDVDMPNIDDKLRAASDCWIWNGETSCYREVVEAFQALEPQLLGAEIDAIRSQ